MSLLGRLTGVGTEQRSDPSVSDLQTPQSWLVNALTGGSTYTGKPVTTDSAMSLVSVWSCINLLATSVGSISCRAYQENADGINKIPNSTLDRLVYQEANPEMPAALLWETAMVQLLTSGNAFIYKGRDGNGLVDSLWPQRSENVRIGRVDGQKIFEVTINGTVYPASTRDILHIRSVSRDGLLGLSPIGVMRQALGVQLAQQEYLGRFYQNNGQPSGILSAKGALREDQATRLKAEWESSHSGLNNAAKVAVLQDGLTWTPLGLPLDDQQLIEQRKFGVAEVARMFSIPSYMLNEDGGSSLTYRTSETSMNQFATLSLRPWCKRLENFIRYDGDLALLPGSYVKFNLNELVRADIATRTAAFGLALDKGWMLPHEVREAEELPEIEGIDDRPRPVASVAPQPA